LSERKPGSVNEGIYRGEQVSPSIVYDKNRFFPLPRRKIMMINQNYFIAVRGNNLAI